ncbi:hypothetical protein EVAR_68074_1 [Eumeta japonica]|uniref:Uncharacterized protein n=1 Tax=Eumeta variegata TaxID=151549 RepID=A0A4C1ZWL5_EUMVA|nr:hypothetical protein EVAR_68074_1 [Eumeta japonica]
MPTRILYTMVDCRLGPKQTQWCRQAECIMQLHSYTMLYYFRICPSESDQLDESSLDQLNRSGCSFVGQPRLQWSQVRDGGLTIASCPAVFSSGIRTRRIQVVMAP